VGYRWNTGRVQDKQVGYRWNTGRVQVNTGGIVGYRWTQVR
jgi:hypothetical protein